LPRGIGGGGGAANAIAGVGIPLLASGLGKALSGGNPLDALKGDPTSNPFSPEARAANELADRDAARNRENIGDAFRQFGDFLKDPLGTNKRQELERMGDKFKNPTRKGNGETPTGSIAGKDYLVTYTSSFGGQTLTLKGPIGGVVTSNYTDAGGIKRVDANFSHGGGTVNIFTGAPEGSTASITSKIPLDGIQDPAKLADPESFREPNGLALPTTLGDTPILPNLGLNRPAPTKASKPGSSNPVRSGDSLPSQQRPGDASKQPQAGSPTVPSLRPPLNGPMPSLPNIPAAPTTGSATAQSPIFPSSFTQTPSVRNPNAMQPIQPQPGKLPQPTPCADPCMRTLQNQQAEQGNSLEGLGELLQSLLDGQQEPDKPAELSSIQVPLIFCRADGNADEGELAVEVPKGLENLYLQLFRVVSFLHREECKTNYFAERSHNILGGNQWFTETTSRNPVRRGKLEREIQLFAESLGFPKVEPENPQVVAAEEALEQQTNQPTPGKQTTFNLPDYLKALTSILYHRSGLHGFPAKVPETLLGYSDAKPLQTVKDFASYFHWYLQQFDALVGKFPINIRVEDIDPLTPGNQIKEIELPNISEALAEMYGMNIGTSVNADVSVNFLMRLASEVIATKNSSLITQDYVRGNAAFLGYKGNPARREVNYSFDPAKLGSLDEFLKESKGYLVGWEEDDKESVVGFLQRIVFSSGIIKAAFFRDKDRLAELQKEIESMAAQDKAGNEAEWNAILALLNDPGDYFNKDAIPKPRVREKPVPPPPPEA
jgi:hypothetical protein